MLKRFSTWLKRKYRQVTYKTNPKITNPKITITQALLRFLKDTKKYNKSVIIDGKVHRTVILKSMYLCRLASVLNFPLRKHVNYELWESLLPQKSFYIHVNRCDYERFAEFCDDNGLMWRSLNLMSELNPFDVYLNQGENSVCIIVDKCGVCTYETCLRRALSVETFKAEFLMWRQGLDDFAYEIFKYNKK